ncbi:MAG: hypothetical protein AB1422_12660 [bacterium]
MGIKRATKISIGWVCILCMFSPVVYGKVKEPHPIPIYVIERDTLQTRNFIPVVNHETMIINLGKRSVRLDLVSKIPEGKYREGEGYPAFLEDSLLPEPLFSLKDISPKKTLYLEHPEFDKDENAYIWKGILLPPAQNLIAQYDNYFGEYSHYWTAQGFDFQGIKIKTSYISSKLNESEWELSLSYDIENATGYQVKDFSMSVFLPVKEIRKEDEVSFIDLQQICASPNIEVSQVTKSDGYGCAAYGVMANLGTSEFDAEGKIRFFVCIAGALLPNNGSIWPTINITGRLFNQESCWPATLIKTDIPVAEEHFSYTSYNLVIKDSHTFTFHQGEVVVQQER